MLKEKIIELRERGLSYKQIEKELGCARSTIQYHCKNEGLNKNLPQPNKLVDELVDRIREEYRTRPAKQIAERYGISKGVVYNYCKNVSKRKKVLYHTIICKQCNESHNTHHKNILFCSQKCKNDYHRNKKK